MYVISIKKTLFLSIAKKSPLKRHFTVTDNYSSHYPIFYLIFKILYYTLLDYNIYLLYLKHLHIYFNIQSVQIPGVLYFVDKLLFPMHSGFHSNSLYK